MASNSRNYRPIKLLCAGPEAVTYLGRSPTNEKIELRILKPAALDLIRWSMLSKQIRLARSFQHEAALPVQEVQLQHQPPFLVLPIVKRKRYQREPVNNSDCFFHVLHQAWRLSGLLADAHRHGLVHGNLIPAALFRDESGKIRLDLTGVACGQTPTPDLETFVDQFSDSHDFGRLFCWLLTGQTELVDLGSRLAFINPNLLDTIHFIIESTQVEEPTDRPLLADIHQLLDKLLNSPRKRLYDTQQIVPEEHITLIHPDGKHQLQAQVRQQSVSRQQLGRFRLYEPLGEGGMGTVYRAEDITDGSIVALKVLRADRFDASTLKRFYKEARLLAALDTPHIAKLVEFNQEDGVFYLASEYVAGQSLGKLLNTQGRLPETLALAYVADVCRALAAAHRKGIIHRDVKPENILLVGPDRRRSEGSYDSYALRAKLIDFGLARTEQQGQSLAITLEGASLGTPLYMSPEQARGLPLDPRTDVYSLGVTLFHMLTGRPPFVADTAMSVMAQHVTDPLPSLRVLQPNLSEPVIQIVERATQKTPAARYPDAESLLVDLERVLRGEPTSMEIHPKLPTTKSWVGRWSFTLDLQASPQQLWPHIANTERVNRAIGLPAVEFTTKVDPEFGVRRFASTRLAGMLIRWEEHPFEWIEGKRMGVLREFHTGPLRWFTSVIDFTPLPTGGTRLTQTIQIIPRNSIGRLVAYLEGGIKAPRALKRVYKRIDQTLANGATSVVDPFEPAARLSNSQQLRLEQRLDQLATLGLPVTVLEKLSEFLAAAAPQEVARIRPIGFANRFKLHPDEVITTLLHACQHGIVHMFWDILCPICKISADVKTTLAQLADHSHCPACHLDFTVDFAQSVELIFRAHPEIRPVELRTYCIGGPAHSPHVAAQAKLHPGERIELHLSLGEGSYRLRSPQLTGQLGFRVKPEAQTRRWDCSLKDLQTNALAAAPMFIPDNQVIVIHNDRSGEAVVRVERVADREDAFTAAQASANALFRRLFPTEILAPGQLVHMAHLYLLCIRLDQGDELYQQFEEATAFRLIHETIQQAERVVAEHGGSLVKTIGHGLLAVFPQPETALQSARKLANLVAEHADRAVPLVLVNQDVPAAVPPLTLSMALHAGPAMVTTIDDRLDYFGTVVNQLCRLHQLAQPGELLLGLSLGEQLAATQQLGTTSPQVVLDPNTGTPLGLRVQLMQAPSSNPTLSKIPTESIYLSLLNESTT